MEYIREELACFSDGMSRSMKKTFGFMNITGGHFQNITNSGHLRLQYQRLQVDYITTNNTVGFSF
jgi:hypothetical protein